MCCVVRADRRARVRAIPHQLLEKFSAEKFSSPQEAPVTDKILASPTEWRSKGRERRGSTFRDYKILDWSTYRWSCCLDGASHVLRVLSRDRGKCISVTSKSRQAMNTLARWIFQDLSVKSRRGNHSPFTCSLCTLWKNTIFRSPPWTESLDEGLTTSWSINQKNL